MRVDSRGWGAAPPPFVLAHFVCSAWPGAAGREQAMRAWGHWRPKSIGREMPSYARSWREARSLMVGLRAPVALSSGRHGTLDDMMLEAYEWARLVIALAAATGRTPVLPAMRCTEKLMHGRCVWHVPASGSAAALSLIHISEPTRPY